MKYQDRIDELVAKFPNGKKRFWESKLFHDTIRSLARGSSPFEVIDGIIAVADKTMAEYIKLQTVTPHPGFIVMTCERVNDLNSNRCVKCGAKAGHPCELTPIPK